VLLHFLCGSSGFDERGLFYLKTGEGDGDRLRIADVVHLMLTTMHMLRVLVVVDGLDDSEYAARVVASIGASLEAAYHCCSSARAPLALKKLVVTVASGPSGVFQDALFGALCNRRNGKADKRQLFVAAGGRDVFLLQRDPLESDQLFFAAKMLDTAQRASGGEHPAHVSVVLHQGVDGCCYGVYGRASHTMVLSGSWLQEGAGRSERTTLPALVNDLLLGDTAAYDHIRRILMELLFTEEVALYDKYLLATQCVCASLSAEGEPAAGGEHLIAALAMLIVVNSNLLWTLRHWPRACALAGQLRALRFKGFDLRGAEQDPYLLLLAAAQPVATESARRDGRVHAISGTIAGLLTPLKHLSGRAAGGPLRSTKRTLHVVGAVCLALALKSRFGGGA
jgi:hypothetical protein